MSKTILFSSAALISIAIGGGAYYFVNQQQGDIFA